jgi:hypothetical protein
MVEQSEERKKVPFLLPVLQVLGIVVVAIVILGLVFGWSTRVQYSNAFFWAAIIAAGIAVGSSMAFSGAVIRSVYGRHGRGASLMDNIRQDYTRTKPTRRFAGQMLTASGFCFGLSVLIGL